jgi:hypothetical protein
MRRKKSVFILKSKTDEIFGFAQGSSAICPEWSCSALGGKDLKVNQTQKALLEVSEVS